jgi:hypothetical protein
MKLVSKREKLVEYVAAAILRYFDIMTTHRGGGRNMAVPFNKADSVNQISEYYSRVYSVEFPDDMLLEGFNFLVEMGVARRENEIQSVRKYAFSKEKTLKLIDSYKKRENNKIEYITSGRKDFLDAVISDWYSLPDDPHNPVSATARNSFVGDFKRYKPLFSEFEGGSIHWSKWGTIAGWLSLIVTVWVALGFRR